MSRGRAGRVRIDSLASSKTRTESRRSPDHTKLRPLPASPAPAANAGSPAPHWSSRPGGRPRPAPSRIRGDPELPRDIPARRTPVRTIFTICCFRNSLGPGFAWSRLRISQGLPCAPSPSAEPLPLQAIPRQSAQLQHIANALSISWSAQWRYSRVAAARSQGCRLRQSPSHRSPWLMLKIRENLSMTSVLLRIVWIVFTRGCAIQQL